MFAKRKRFTLLLLEDEERYVQDWVVSCVWPKNVEGNWQGLDRLSGRLRLCTKSLFFDPDDVRLPIVRFPFPSVTDLEADTSGSTSNTFALTVNQLIKMKENGEDVPYKVEKGTSSRWLFKLSYARLDSFMPLAQEQLVASRLPHLERLQFTEDLVRAREDAVQFDSSRLLDFGERLCWEGPAVAVTPLVVEPGRLAVTDQRVYFQPLHNITGDAPVKSHALAAVAAVVRRRCSLRPTGLELFFLDPEGSAAGRPAVSPRDVAGSRREAGPVWGAASAFFALRTEADRNKVLQVITSQQQLGSAVASLAPGPAARAAAAAAGGGSSQQHGAGQGRLSSGSSGGPVDGGVLQEVAGHVLEAEGQWLWRVSRAWRLGKVSNFDYLMYLNLAAGRSFNDLAQWPVYPWVLSDYSSSQLDLNSEASFRDLTKPMGAQTEARLQDFRRRYRELSSLPHDPDMAGVGGMPEPFMYGTHYSTPGYVMFWLVRAAPGHMLRLQSGRFDQPDRLFHSIADSWESATSSSTDVKELIPEFFMPGGDFLVNAAQLPLGKRQNGTAVQDVVLPPWATSPQHFLAVHRAALEAPYVSAHLHQWIDLIFGCKQRGPAAVEADNVFYHLTYEGAVDISKVTNLVELRALETQINEFGQVPKQLFHVPHPARQVCPPAPDPATIFLPNCGAAPHTPGSRAAAVGPRGEGEAVALNGKSATVTATGLGLGVVPGVGAGTAAGRSSSSSSRLKGGGEDAAGGAVVLALLHTILAAVDEGDYDGPCGSATTAGGVASGVEGAGKGPAAAAAVADVLDAGKLSPLKDSEYLSAAPLPLPDRSRPIGAAVAAGAAGNGGVGRGVSLGSRVLSGVGAAWSFGKGATAARAASAGESDSSGKGEAVVPERSVGSGSGSSSSSGKGSMSWVQQQLRRGLQLGGGGTIASAAAGAQGPQLPPPGSAVTGDGGSGGGGVSGPAASGSTVPAAAQALSSTPLTRHSVASGANTPAEAVGTAETAPTSAFMSSGGYSSSSSSRVVGSTAAPPASEWPEALVQQLLICGSTRLQREPVTGLAVAGGGAGGAPLVCCVGYDGLLRMLQLPQLEAYRSAKLPNDLLSVTVLPWPVGGTTISSRATGSSSVSAGCNAVLAMGSSGGQVVAFSVAAGKVLGSFAGHEDAVSCVGALGQEGSRLLTASWDCTIKVWDVCEGRQPWTSTLPMPISQLEGLESGVWAVAAAPSGQLLVAGTEEGGVHAWDLRTRGTVWSTRVSQDYVGGLTWLPGGAYVGVAAADGGLSLLEWRREGQALVHVECGAPLRCCIGNDHAMVAGSEAGQLQLWDVGQMTGKSSGVVGTAVAGGLVGRQKSVDGLYPPLACESKAAVNALCMVPGQGDRKWSLFVGQEDGMLAQFST